MRRTLTVPALEVCDLEWPAAAGVVLRGVVDDDGARLLAEALEEAILASSGPFLVDLREVVAMDPCGAAALLRARSLLGQDDRRLALVGASWPVRTVLEDVGVADLFAAYASRPAALRAMARPGRPG